MEEKKKSPKVVKPIPPKPIPPQKPLKPEFKVADDSINKEIKEEDTENKKIKNHKTQIIKKSRKKLKLLILLGTLFLTVCLALIITFIVITNNKNNKKLQTPTLFYEQYFNGTVLVATKIDGAVSYEFEITNPAGKKSVNISSKNYLELGEASKEAGEYSVKVRVFGKGAGATSDYSEIVRFSNFVKLQTPTIFVNNLNVDLDKNLVYKTNENLTDDTITWDIVPNATKYLVRYGVDLQTYEIKSEQIESTEDVVTFNLSNIYEKGTGVYQISVIAISDSEYYVTSDYDKIVTIEYYAEQDMAQKAKYNKTLKELTFELKSSAKFGSEFDLYITTQTKTIIHRIYMKDCVTTQDPQKITIVASLSHIKEIDNLDIVAMGLITLSDSQFSTSSEMAEVTIQ